MLLEVKGTHFLTDRFNNKTCLNNFLNLFPFCTVFTFSDLIEKNGIQGMKDTFKLMGKKLTLSINIHS